MSSKKFNAVIDRFAEESTPLTTVPVLEQKPIQSTGLTTSSSTQRLGIVGLAPTLCVVLLSSGFAFAILAYVLGRQSGIKGVGEALRSGAFLVNEGEGGETVVVQLRVLTMSSLASTLVSLTGSILMPIVAYRTAARWLDGSLKADASNLTPLQYGLLVGLLGTSSIMNLYQSFLYTLRGTGRRARIPGLFKEALVIAFFIYFLGHAVGIVDLWLHATTESVSTNQYIQNMGSPSMFGVAFNESICAERWPTTPCLGGPGGWAMDSEANLDDVFDQSALALTNSSSRYATITLHEANDTAVAIPGRAVTHRAASFKAPTFGAKAECTLLTRLCDRPKLYLNCTNMGYPGFPSENLTSSHIFGIINGVMSASNMSDGGNFWALPEPRRIANPGLMALQLMWPVHVNVVSTVSSTGPDSVVDTWSGSYTLYAACNVTYYNATVQYRPENDTWALVDAVPTPPETASSLWTGLVYQLASEALTTEIMGIAMVESYQNVTAALNQALGRAALSAVSGVFVSAPATEVTRMVPIVLGRYPAAPVITLVALLLLYSVMALVIFVTSWKSNSKAIMVPAEFSRSGTRKERSALDIAQIWLTTPVPLVASVFPGGDGGDVQRSVALSELDMVHDGDGNAGRLTIGLHPDRPEFGIRRL